jgi:hypothetical protein
VKRFRWDFLGVFSQAYPHGIPTSAPLQTKKKEATHRFNNQSYYRDFVARIGKLCATPPD